MNNYQITTGEEFVSGLQELIDISILDKEDNSDYVGYRLRMLEIRKKMAAYLDNKNKQNRDSETTNETTHI